MYEMIVNYVGVIIGSITTVMFTYHLKSRGELKDKVVQLSEEVNNLKSERRSDKDLFSHQLTNLDTEIKEVKRSIREDNAEIKGAIQNVTASLQSIAESQGEFRGIIQTLFKERRPYE